MSGSVKDIFDHKDFNRLKTAFLTYFYQSPKHFTFLIAGQAGLERMIKILPKEEEPKLRLYYELLTLKMPIKQIMNGPNCQDPFTIAELKLFQERKLIGGPIKAIQPDIKAVVEEGAIFTGAKYFC